MLNAFSLLLRSVGVSVSVVAVTRAPSVHAGEEGESEGTPSVTKALWKFDPNPQDAQVVGGGVAATVAVRAVAAVAPSVAVSEGDLVIRDSVRYRVDSRPKRDDDRTILSLVEVR